jgi:hypothetical protein
MAFRALSLICTQLPELSVSRIGLEHVQGAVPGDLWEAQPTEPEIPVGQTEVASFVLLTLHLIFCYRSYYIYDLENSNIL